MNYIVSGGVFLKHMALSKYGVLFITTILSLMVALISGEMVFESISKEPEKYFLSPLVASNLIAMFYAIFGYIYYLKWKKACK